MTPRPPERENACGERCSSAICVCLLFVIDPLAMTKQNPRKTPAVPYVSLKLELCHDVMISSARQLRPPGNSEVPCTCILWTLQQIYLGNVSEQVHLYSFEEKLQDLISDRR